VLSAPAGAETKRCPNSVRNSANPFNRSFLVKNKAPSLCKNFL